MTLISTIPLLVIDYDLLMEKNEKEINRLFEISTELGFFYLKLNDQLDPDPLFTLAENVFDLPLDNKMEYVMDGKNGVYFGYKAVGGMYTDRQGTPDTIEFWNISKDKILLHNQSDFPQPILESKNIIKQYMIKAHSIALVILEILSIKLGLDSQTLPSLHRLMQPSGDQLRMTKSTMYPMQEQCSPDIALGAHTDFGSITILFNRLWGLQILTPSNEWLYVEPLSGHAIVNLGDAMVKLSNGIFKSNIHRVINTPNITQKTDRYSIVYFARPENDILMKSLINDDETVKNNEPILTAQQWVATRVKNLQSVNYKNEETYETSRGTEGHRETKF